MATFTDNKKRNWGIEISITVLKRVRNELDLNLVQIFSGDLLDRLAGDPLLLGELLWVLCAEQAHQRGVTPEEFGHLSGDALAGPGGALEALEVALADFFPTQKRSALKLWIQKRNRMEDLAIDAATRDLKSDRMERLLKKILEESDPFSEPPTSSGPSSDWTPAPSPSADSSA
jgi:hypothetical protein